MKKWQRVDGKTSIYALLDPRTGFVRYVGKTSSKLSARLALHVSQAKDFTKHDRRYWVLHWVHSLLEDGLRPSIVEIDVVEAGGDWPEAEKFWIEMLRCLGCDLCNVREGGEAGNYTKQSPDWIEKRASKLRGRPGKKLSPEHKAVAVAALARGRIVLSRQAPEVRRARSLAGVEASRKVPRDAGFRNRRSRAVIVDGIAHGSVNEACKALSVTRRTIYNWLGSGRASRS